MIVNIKDTNYHIDEEEYEFFISRKWCIDKDGYLFTHIKQSNGVWTTRRYHRLILGVSDRNIFVDHINRDVKDNRKSNLRLSNSKTNGYNRGNTRNSSSKYKGVTVKNNKNSITYRAYIRVDGKYIDLGSYCNEDVAGFVYNIHAKKYYEEFACLNDVKDFSDEEVELNKSTKSKSNSKRKKVK